MFTTNHVPFWLEQDDRRFYVVEVDHEGHQFGPNADVFGALVAETLEYLEDPFNLAMLYNALMQHRIPKGFSAISLDVQRASTGVMKTIQSASWDLNIELFEDELNRMQLVAIPASSLTTFSEAFATMKVNAMKHWLFDLKWEREKVKWGGADYARCPSSYKLGHKVGLRYGGSGSSVGLIMQPAFDVASVDTRLSVF